MKTSVATKVRTVVLVLSLLNQFVASLSGILEFLPENVTVWYNLISTVITAVASSVSFWYNNSFTKEAKEADKVLNELKKAKKEGAEDNEA